MIDWTPVITKMPSPAEVLAQPERPDATPEQRVTYIAACWLAYPWSESDRLHGRALSSNPTDGPRLAQMMRDAGWDAIYTPDGCIRVSGAKTT